MNLSLVYLMRRWIDIYSLPLKEDLWKFQRYFVSNIKYWSEASSYVVSSSFVTRTHILCVPTLIGEWWVTQWIRGSKTFLLYLKKNILYLSSSKTFISKTYHHIRNQITNETQDEPYHNEWMNETANDCKRLYEEGQKTNYFRSKQLMSRRKETNGVGWSVSN